jgi:hypothetical protein
MPFPSIPKTIKANKQLKTMEKSEMQNAIKEEIQNVLSHKEHLHDGCAACHIIFSLKNKTGSSEQDCADMLSEILTENPGLNKEFIEAIEKIHMIERDMGGTFALRERESKDAYLDAYFASALEELRADIAKYSQEAVLRKLVLAYISLYLAQTIGVDYHAATEEIYYILRKTESKNAQIDELISKIQAGQNRF